MYVEEQLGYMEGVDPDEVFILGVNKYPGSGYVSYDYLVPEGIGWSLKKAWRKVKRAGKKLARKGTRFTKKYLPITQGYRKLKKAIPRIRSKLRQGSSGMSRFVKKHHPAYRIHRGSPNSMRRRQSSPRSTRRPTRRTPRMPSSSGKKGNSRSRRISVPRSTSSQLPRLDFPKTETASTPAQKKFPTWAKIGIGVGLGLAVIGGVILVLAKRKKKK